MPSLTLDTSPKSLRGTSQDIESHPTSPKQPPYSPITPTLSAARFATVKENGPHSSGIARQTYTHSQPHQEAISLPALEPINFDTNPDVLALKATISILQMQGSTAKTDIQTLERTKIKALRDPEEFARALYAGEIRTQGDVLFHPESEEIDVVADDGEEEVDVTREEFDRLPGPQNVVRMPPINWAQYGVVGDSLDKLHNDQLARPADGVPQRIGAEGQIIHGGEGIRRQAAMGIAAPYQPSKDKIEKSGTKKGGKR